MGLTFWNIIKISILLVNAIAILSEERFLARSESRWLRFALFYLTFILCLCVVGWSTQQSQIGQAGFAQPYDAYGGGGGAGQGELSIKAKIINLISAVRTLMRSESMLGLYFSTTNNYFSVPLIGVNFVWVTYELLLGWMKSSILLLCVVLEASISYSNDRNAL